MEHVIVFTKYPHTGFAKTRLIPRLGAEGAALVSRALSERCVCMVRSYVGEGSGRAMRIYYAGRTTEDEMKEWLGEAVYKLQCKGDLGERMVNALEQSFEEGAQRVVIVGTDIPALDTVVLGDAFDGLKADDVDVVGGPAEDGGYYLIGMRRLHADLFRDVEWSTGSVFETTRLRVQENGLKMKELGVLRDVDMPEDVVYLRTFMEVPPDMGVE